jgi:hypothetical protein
LLRSLLGGLAGGRGVGCRGSHGASCELHGRGAGAEQERQQ